METLLSGGPETAEGDRAEPKGEFAGFGADAAGCGGEAISNGLALAAASVF